MKCGTSLFRILAPAAGVLIGLCVARPSLAQLDVAPGYDLFQTVSPGTEFMGVPLMGVPLGNFNFGGTIGLQNVGDTDTIIQRLGPAIVPAVGDSATVSLVMDSLNLETVTPGSFGGGPVGNYFISLQSQTPTGGTASTGTQTITFLTPESGTFSSSLDVFYNVTFGSETGPVVASGDLVLSSTGVGWSNVAPPGSVLINGANYMLDGIDTLQDFFPVPPFTEAHPGGVGTHTVTDATTGTPEPGSLAMLSSGGLFGLCLLRRRVR